MTDTAENWTRLPVGSDEELIGNFLRGDSERRFRLLCALRDTILATTARSRDPAIGAVKLDWWRQELARLATGEPRHPLTRGLAEVLPAASPFVPWLEELVICAESLGRGETPETADQLRLYCFRREGAALTLAAAPRGDDPAEQSRCTAARHAGIAWGMAKTTAALARGQQLFLLPRDMAADAGLDEVPPGKWPEQDRFRRVLEGLADAGLEELARAGPVIRSASAVTSMVAAVSEAHLSARRRAGTRGPAHPLQLLWHAWRAARGQARAPTTRDQEQP
ncbi:squalene/phytoene synthase family protein [Lentisalinibacter sediminis]|uniref:squalene/phytoene synthase family protein n=1 Tax=Lentisalinibacter sediminis TaxID=2992237 RepID=UPI003867C6C3